MSTFLLAVLLHAEPRVFDARIDQAQVLRSQGQRSDALNLLQVVETEAKTKKDPVSEGRALQKRGDLQLDLSQCEASKTSYEAAIQALGKADPIASAQTWNDLGMWAKQCATPAEQKVFFANALGLYEDLQDQKGIRKLANNLGTANFVADDKTTALGFFKKAAAAAKALGDDEALLTGQANIALMELLLSQDRLGHECTEFTPAQRGDRGFQRAVAAFGEAGKIAKRLGKTPLAVCAKFGGDYSPLCEPCLIKR